jgi:hypothetical protein
MPNRETTAHCASDLWLILGVAAFMLGVAMVSQVVLLSQPPTHLVPITHAAPGQVEKLLPVRDEDPLATTPPADLVAPTHVISATSSGRTRVVAECAPRLALTAQNCDLRLVLMDLALLQRGLVLGRPVARSEQRGIPAWRPESTVPNNASRGDAIGTAICNSVTGHPADLSSWSCDESTSCSSTLLHHRSDRLVTNAEVGSECAQALGCGELADCGLLLRR